MSADLERFFQLKTEYESRNSLGKAILLDNEMREFEASVRSPSVRIAVSKFIQEKNAESRARSAERAIEQKLQRDAKIDQLIENTRNWALGNVPQSISKGLIRTSAWWLTHSSGKPVRAPKHAARLAEMKWGWSIEFGANHFLVGRAFQRSAGILIAGFEMIKNDQIVDRARFSGPISAVIPGCVGNYKHDEYEHYAPERGLLVFGAQAIKISEATDFIINASGISVYFLHENLLVPLKK